MEALETQIKVPTPSTTISTIVLQSGRIKLVIALLHCDGWIQLKIFETEPSIALLADTLKEALELQKTHNDVLLQLQSKKSPVEELLKQADHLILIQHPRAEVYEAMAESLSKAWNEINYYLKYRKDIIDLNVLFLTKADECKQYMTELENACKNTVVPIEIEAVKKFLTNIHELKKSILEALNGALQQGNALLLKLNELYTEGSLDSRVDKIKPQCKTAINKVEKWIEELHDKRQLLDLSWNERKQQLEQCLALAVLMKDLKEVESLLINQETEFHHNNTLGVNLADAQELAQLNRNFAYDAKILQERALKITKAIEILLSNSTFIKDESTSHAYRILDHSSAFMNDIDARIQSLEKAVEFFQSAGIALEKLNTVEQQFKGTEITVSPGEMLLYEQIHENLKEITQDPLTMGYELLSSYHAGDKAVDGIQKVVDDLESRKQHLYDLCGEHCTKTKKIYDELSEYLRQLSEFDDWINKTAKNFIDSNRFVGNDSSAVNDFRKLHENMLIEINEKGTAINNLLLNLQKLVIYLDDNQRHDVDNRVEALHNNWAELKNLVESRLEIINTCIKFFSIVEVFSDKLSQFENKLKNVDLDDESAKNELKNLWENIQPEFEDCKLFGNQFLDEDQKLDEGHLDSSRNIETARNLIYDLESRYEKAAKKWEEFNSSLDNQKQLKQEIELNQSKSQEITSNARNLVSRLYPIITSSSDNVMHINSEIANNFEKNISEIREVKSTLIDQIKTTEILKSNAKTKENETQLNTILDDLYDCNTTVHQTASSYEDLSKKITSYFNDILQLEKQKDDLENKYCLHNIPENLNEIEALKLEHDSAKQNVLDVFKDIQNGCDQLIRAIRNQEPNEISENDIGKVMHCINQTRNQFEILWDRNIYNIQQRKELSQFNFDLHQINTTLDHLSSQLENISKNLGHSLQDVEQTSYAFGEFEKTFVKFEDRINKFVRTGENMLENKHTHSPVIQDEIENLNLKRAEIKNKAKDTRKLIDLGVRYFQLIEEAKTWFEEGGKVLYEIANKAKFVTKSEEVNELLNELEVFLKPGENRQDDRIKEILELSSQLYIGGQHADDVVRENTEFLDSLVGLNNELNSLAMNLRRAEEKERQVAEQIAKEREEALKQEEHERKQLEILKAQIEENERLEKQRLQQEAEQRELERLKQEEIKRIKMEEEEKERERFRKIEEERLKQEELERERLKTEQEILRLETEAKEREILKEQERLKLESEAKEQELQKEQERLRLEAEEKERELLKEQERLRLETEAKERELLKEQEKLRLEAEEKRIQQEHEAKQREIELQRQAEEIEKKKFLAQKAEFTKQEALVLQHAPIEYLPTSSQTTKIEMYKSDTIVTSSYKIDSQPMQIEQISSSISSFEEGQSPSILKPLANIVVDADQPLTLTCEISGKPTPLVQWHLNGDVIHENDQQKISFENNVASLLLPHASSNTVGNYTLTASNKYGTCQSTANVIVIEKERPKSVTFKDNDTVPKFLTSLNDTDVEENQSAILECTITGYPEPEVIWFHNGFPIKESQNYQLLFVDDKCSLHIKKVRTNDAGEYKVKAINNKGEASKSCYLNVKAETAKLSPPIFIKILSDVTAVEGSELVLECQVLGEPTPTLNWLKNDKQIDSNDGRYKITKEGQGVTKLKIIRTRKEDAGKYTLEAQNSIDCKHSTCNVNIEVTALPPVFQKHLDDQIINENGSVEFQCVVTGTPKPSVRWFINGKAPKDEDVEINNIENIYTMRIENVSASHQGVVTCTAENVNGEVQSVGKLTVKCLEQIKPQKADQVFIAEPGTLESKSSSSASYSMTSSKSVIISKTSFTPAESAGYTTEEIKVTEVSSPKLAIKGRKSVPPQFINPLVGKIVNQGADVILEGTFTGYPTPEIKWFKNNAEISSDENVVLTYHNNTVKLEIKNISNELAGRYSCTLVNECGTVTSTADIVVKKKTFPPVFGRRLQAQVVKKGERVVMEVEVTGTPDPEITWFKDDEIIKFNNLNYLIKKQGTSHSLVIEKADQKHTGKYMVKAENSAGVAQNSADFAVFEPPPASMTEVVKTTVFEDVQDTENFIEQKLEHKEFKKEIIHEHKHETIESQFKKHDVTSHQPPTLPFSKVEIPIPDKFPIQALTTEKKIETETSIINENRFEKVIPVKQIQTIQKPIESFNEPIWSSTKPPVTSLERVEYPFNDNVLEDVKQSYHHQTETSITNENRFEKVIPVHQIQTIQKPIESFNEPVWSSSKPPVTSFERVEYPFNDNVTEDVKQSYHHQSFSSQSKTIKYENKSPEPFQKIPDISYQPIAMERGEPPIFMNTNDTKSKLTEQTIIKPISPVNFTTETSSYEKKSIPDGESFSHFHEKDSFYSSSTPTSSLSASSKQVIKEERIETLKPIFRPKADGITLRAMSPKPSAEALQMEKLWTHRSFNEEKPIFTSSETSKLNESLQESFESYSSVEKSSNEMAIDDSSIPFSNTLSLFQNYPQDEPEYKKFSEFKQENSSSTFKKVEPEIWSSSSTHVAEQTEAEIDAAPIPFSSTLSKFKKYSEETSKSEMSSFSKSEELQAPKMVKQFMPKIDLPPPPPVGFILEPGPPPEIDFAPSPCKFEESSSYKETKYQQSVSSLPEVKPVVTPAQKRSVLESKIEEKKNLTSSQFKKEEHYSSESKQFSHVAAPVTPIPVQINQERETKPFANTYIATSTVENNFLAPQVHENKMSTSETKQIFNKFENFYKSENFGRSRSVEPVRNKSEARDYSFKSDVFFEPLPTLKPGSPPQFLETQPKQKKFHCESGYMTDTDEPSYQSCKSQDIRKYDESFSSTKETKTVWKPQTDFVPKQTPEKVFPSKRKSSIGEKVSKYESTITQPEPVKLTRKSSFEAESKQEFKSHEIFSSSVKAPSSALVRIPDDKRIFRPIPHFDARSMVSSEHTETTSLKPGSPPEIRYAPKPQPIVLSDSSPVNQVMFFKSITYGPDYKATQTENVIHVNKDENKAINIQQTTKTIEISDFKNQQRKHEFKLRPKKFTPKDFQESDYESELDSSKIKPVWLPSDSEVDEPKYKKVKPPSRKLRSTSLPSRQETESRFMSYQSESTTSAPKISTALVPSKPIFKHQSSYDHHQQKSSYDKQISNQVVRQSYDHRQQKSSYDNKTSNRQSYDQRQQKSSYDDQLSNKVVRQVYLQPGAQPEFCFAPSAPDAAKVASNYVNSMKNTFKSTTKHFSDEIMNAAKSQKQEKANDAQYYKEDSRVAQYGTKHIDPDTGLIYFKYDFGYEFGVVVPGVKAKELPHNAKQVKKQIKRYNDIDIPVLHETTQHETTKSSLNKNKKFYNRYNRYDAVSESDVSEWETDSKAKRRNSLPYYDNNYLTAWRSPTPTSNSPSLPSTSPRPPTGLLRDTPSSIASISPSYQSFTSRQVKEVGHPPMFITPLKDIAVVSGQSARFECIVQSDGTATIIWTKDGQVLANNYEHQIYFKNGVCRLTIAKAFTVHGGTYNCTATNSLGTACTTATLQVQTDRRYSYNG